MNDHVALREFIERIIELNERRIDDRFDALDKALKLQAGSYPTVSDFNSLKTHVDVELASRSGSSSAVTTIYHMLTLLSVLSNSILAYFIYAK